MRANYSETARAAAARQMPDVPARLWATLPVDGAPADGMPYLWQSGGWVMVLRCGDRAMTQDDVFYVGRYPDPDDGDSDAPEEGDILYQGPSFQSAWAALMGPMA